MVAKIKQTLLCIVLIENIKTNTVVMKSSDWLKFLSKMDDATAAVP